MPQFTEEDIKELERSIRDYKSIQRKVQRASGELSVPHPIFIDQNINVTISPVELATLSADLNQAQGNLVAEMAQLEEKGKG